MLKLSVFAVNRNEVWSSIGPTFIYPWCINDINRDKMWILERKYANISFIRIHWKMHFWTAATILRMRVVLERRQQDHQFNVRTLREGDYQLMTQTHQRITGSLQVHIFINIFELPPFSHTFWTDIKFLSSCYGNAINYIFKLSEISHLVISKK